MRCWKCKSEMPEGLKYCGNCGVHMNPAVHTIQWLFSKKGLPVLLVVLALILGGVLWAVLKNVDFPDGDIHVDLPDLEFPVDDSPLENQYDFGLYPHVDSYIPGNIKGGGVFQNEDLYDYAEGGDVNFHLVFNEERQAHDSVVVGEYPHKWGRYSFVRSLEDQVWEYLEVLEEKPFYFELVHEEESWYFYRYTGVQEVYALEQPDWVDTDLGEFHMMICIDAGGEGDISFSIRAGLGLEAIYREEQEDILNDVPYHRDTRIVLESAENPIEPAETEPAATETPEPES